MPDAIILDLDGVLLDSEQLWNEAKAEVTREHGGTWIAAAPRAMMGMSSPEWSAYMRDELGVPLAAERIDRLVVARMEELYERELPLLPGAADAVRALAERWPLGLASSSNREIIDAFLDISDLRACFGVVVSSEEVARGKPSPDVYLEAVARLGVETSVCVAVEDSANGIRAADAAGLAVIAVPNPHYPPDDGALALALVTVPDVASVTPELIDRMGSS